MSVPDSLLSVSRSDLVAEQWIDPTLSELYDRVLSKADGKCAARGYLLQDEFAGEEMDAVWGKWCG